ncbi:unnamed protein product [Effrenium voratum]|nr:unnamed protein product [Effrenium voratum]
MLCFPLAGAWMSQTLRSRWSPATGVPSSKRARNGHRRLRPACRPSRAVARELARGPTLGRECGSPLCRRRFRRLLGRPAARRPCLPPQRRALRRRTARSRTVAVAKRRGRAARPPPAAPAAPGAPRLGSTPPWREASMPSWIAQMRADVEATRQELRGEDAQPISRSLSGKLRPLSPASRTKPRERSQELSSPRGSREAKAPFLAPEREAEFTEAQGFDVPLSFELLGEEEALIAWSQTVRLDDVHLDELLLP